MGFGDFTSICEQTPFPLCPLVGSQSPITGLTGIDTKCYARSVEAANTIIFEAATDFTHIIALIMTAIMIIHVRSKFTAVGMFVSMPYHVYPVTNTIQAARKFPYSFIFTWLSPLFL
jgi:hypothetical protein